MFTLPGQAPGMRLAELSRRSGTPRSTIKYYLREGLLPAGAPTARNQASYGPEHVERLALIRALRDVAGLPLEAIARVTRELERGWEGDAIGEALLAVGPRPAPAVAAEDAPELAKLRAEVREFVAALPWTSGNERHQYVDEIAAALWQVRRYLYPDYAVSNLARYAQVAWLLSEAEYELVSGRRADARPRARRRPRGADAARDPREPPLRAHLRRAPAERERDASGADRGRSRAAADRALAESENPEPGLAVLRPRRLKHLAADTEEPCGLVRRPAAHAGGVACPKRGSSGFR